MEHPFLMFLDHTQRRSTVGRSARRRDLYLTTHDTHNRQTSMPPVGHCLLIHEVPRSHTHNDAAQSVGLLWTIDQLVAETST